MATIKAAVHGFGNIGRHVVDCLANARDMECLGVIRRASSLGTRSSDLKGCPDFASIDELAAKQGRPDVVVLCGPSRNVPSDAAMYLGKGYSTVDSFDIHDRIPTVVAELQEAAAENGVKAITAAGWDPGTDSVLRALLEAMAPTGVTFTNFGRGRSMGHSVAVRAIKGVADAVSLTIPIGGGRHSRLVYVLPEKGASFEEIKKAIAADPYFVHDPLDVREVESAEDMERVADNSHGASATSVSALTCALTTLP